MANYFKIFSWHQDFIEPLAEFILTKENPAKTIVLFPHSRPAIFLQKKIAELNNYPTIMPRCITIQDFTSLLEAKLLPGENLLKASHIDSIALLYQAVQDVFNEQNFPREKLNFPLSCLELFMPWGVRLATLMEDFFTAQIKPQNLLHMEGEVSPFASLLLSGLADIHQRYIDLLSANKLTTPAQSAGKVAAQCHKLIEDHTGSDFYLCKNKEIILAGFHLLSGVEEPIARYLWEIENAEICLHTDPALANNDKTVHWAAREHLNWIKKWKAKTEPVSPEHGQNKKNIPGNLKIYEGFDLHSQLLAMGSEVNRLKDEEGSAIMLPSSELLLPTLHSLTTKNINISMGYPLSRSPLAALLQSVIDLQQSAVKIHSDNQEQRIHYHWKSLLKLLHQPYLRMLGEARQLPLREVFSKLEAKILSGGRYISLAELKAALSQIIYEKIPAEQQLSLIPELGPEYDPKILTTSNDLLNQAFELLIGRWEKLSHLSELCALNMDICDFLISEGGELWQRFPLDGEYLFRLKHTVLPSLSQSLLAESDEELSKNSLFSILTASLAAERVPFEAYPLEGVQILGMLESRLLSFKNLYIIETTEDVLPGISSEDPLLPDSLRREIGLPALHERERVMAHTFYRLILSSENVSLFYQTGVGKVGLLDDKKSRSRFIEELLWEMEKEKKQIIKHNEPPLFTISLPVHSPRIEERIITRSAAINQAVDVWINKGISASSLNIYLKCPLRFFYEKIAQVKPRDETPEGDDPAAVGSLIHKVLEDFFRPYIGRRLDKGFTDKNARQTLKAMFLEHLAASELPQNLPYDSLFMLREAGPKRLNDYLDNLPETEILSLEKSFRVNLGVRDRQYLLHGQVDRTDRRDDNVIVLDYKTGKTNSPASNFWSTDNQLWFRMEHWQEDDKSLLSDLDSALKSLQLPVYLFAFNNDLAVQAKNAAFVALADKGKESKLLDKLDPESTNKVINEQIPTLLSFVLTHLHKGKEFAPQPGDQCNYCAWSSICGQKIIPA